MQASFVASLLASSLTYAGQNARAEHLEPSPPVAFFSNGAPRDRALIRTLIEQETAKTVLPPDVAEAVVFVESDYNSAVVGRVGELGLMQVRPETAALLGFRGSLTELRKPEVNIHYGVKYLSQAWRLAGGDLCRALMKYRAGHGEEIMSPRSANYCSRARDRLAALSSPSVIPGPRFAPQPISSEQGAGITMNRKIADRPTQPRDVYAHFKQGTPAASRAFWAVHEARIRVASKKIESHWRAASK